MIFKKMKPDSRGIIISIESIMIAVSIVTSSQIVNAIQNAHVNEGTGDGSYECYVVFFIVLMVYWVAVLVYTVINYCKEKN